ncbi:O-methyltransferase [Cohnella endophytica]|uniref:O-methyltransferase n=1 Tax=Cohnella endophytica TaxID=2419778 RepID=A0A494Y568_9BACL|nr:O-methyltransferase [Cohnella endophytica]RKP55060.1 O-methyltransferase [Cohnella endophytica]
MSHLETWHQVDRYIEEKLIPRDDVLEEVLASNRKEGLPAIDVSPSQGKMLHLFARMQGAGRILEIGTLGGYSTIWLARALPADGRLVSLELSPIHAKVARDNVARAGLESIVEIRVGNALEQLARLEDEHEGPFDLVFIDADKPNNPNYLRWALRFSRPGTVIIGDNVIRDGEVVNSDNPDPRVVGTRQFFDLLAEQPNVTATAIQTVGSKGYDGFVIGIVNG